MMIRTFITQVIPGQTEYHLVQNAVDPTEWLIRTRDHRVLRDENRNYIIVHNPKEAQEILANRVKEK